jgi:hypothetical protein
VQDAVVVVVVVQPEWYFAHGLTLIKDHTEFLVLTVQPLFDSQGLVYFDAKVKILMALE